MRRASWASGLASVGAWRSRRPLPVRQRPAAGVLIPGGVGNSVSGSFIGLAADGVTGLPNGGSGVVIQGGAQGAGVGVNGGNVISGNPGDGVTVTGSVQAQIRGNLIGTSASGLSAVANA